MKILHVGLGDGVGGIETFLHAIASKIDQSQYQFDFLAHKDTTPCFHEEFSSMGCRFHYVTSRRKNPFKHCRELDALLKREQYDIVHCHLPSLSPVEAIGMALRNGARVIAHSHSSALVGGSLLSSFLHHFHYLTLPRKKLTMLAVSDLAGEWMFGKDADYIVLNNGLDVEKFHFSEEGRQAVRDEFGLGEARLLVHVGAFRPGKNQDFLLDVFAALAPMEPETRLLFVGEGPLMESVRSRAQQLGLGDKVIFAGRRNDVSNILSAGDAYIFPSLYEGFPMAVLEAQASGLPCLVADTITRQVNIEERCQFVSLDESVIKWAEYIHALLPLKAGRATAMDAILKTGLDVDSIARRLKGIYEQLMGDMTAGESFVRS